MFTECPQCKTAFRLTATVLRQAQGRVRCGGCGSTFNAIDHLSEETPDDQPSHTQTARAFDHQSRALLDSLDEIAGGENVRIEDTGVEWRVLDVDGASNADDTGAVAGSEQPEPDASGVNAIDDHAATGTINWTFEDPDETVSAAADESAAVDADDTISANLDADPGDGDADSDNAGDDVPVLGSEDTGGQTTFDLPATELRFDDHTPLPDEFYKPAENPGFQAADDARLPAAAAEPPQGPESDRSEPPRDNAAQAATDLADDGGWEDLLAEVDLDESPAVAQNEIATETNAAAETATAAESVAASNETELADADVAGEGNASDQVPDESNTGTASSRDQETESVTGDEAEPPVDVDEADADSYDDDELARSVEMEIDQELMRAAAETGALTMAVAGDKSQTPAKAAASSARADEEQDPNLVESIVMEGDTVTDLLLEAEHTTLAGDSPEGTDDAADAAVPPLRRYGMLAAIALLAISLAAQLVHANREALATRAGFSASLGSLYAVAGKPITPAWDVGGWQFESTNGSTDEADQRLTIFSRILNRSDNPLPYPLVHLALTDRFEEVVGSRILSPVEYLAGNGSPDRPVAAGAGFTAVIAVDAPSPDATGFKLNVCYRLSGKQLRCAIEDFRD